MYNRDNAYEVEIFPDEKITKRNEPTNQAQKFILPLIKGLKYAL